MDKNKCRGLVEYKPDNQSKNFFDKWDENNPYNLAPPRKFKQAKHKRKKR